MNKSKNYFTPEKKLETIEKIIGLIQREYEDTIQEFKTINCTGLLMRSVLYDAVKVANERFTEEIVTQNLSEEGIQKQVNKGDGKMKNLQSFRNENLNLQVRIIQNDDGSISVNAEDTAIGFGFTQVKNNKVYVRWETIIGYLNALGFSQQVGKDDFIPESLFYMLGMKANNKVAQNFQKWLAIDVIPQIRKTGSYQSNNQKTINEFKGQLATLVNDMFEEKLSDVKEYYKIKAQSKVDISSYIKKRLGILRADDEYEQVKTRVFLILGINKWEDLDVDSYKTILPVIDESIRVIKLDRPQQTSFFDIA
ncbi:MULTISPECIES: hypothetical protein [unclassified Clostridium]|uniref:BRO-N domain-containing protein n=1 Tax=unclassified Clostridium TaxID=2614128 RepID=UPI002079F017|nr:MULTISPECIES: hypothetical protein [unclassified Clostridium]